MHVVVPNTFRAHQVHINHQMLPVVLSRVSPVKAPTLLSCACDVWPAVDVLCGHVYCTGARVDLGAGRCWYRGGSVYGYKIMRVLGVKAVKVTNARGFCHSSPLPSLSSLPPDMVRNCTLLRMSP